MKKIKKENLIDGEIYICFVKSLNIQYLIKKTNNFRCTNIEILPLKKHLFTNGVFSNITNEFYEATPKEKHWLEVCIAANSFISYDEAVKNFIPEYVELLSGWSVGGEFVGEIFNTKKDFQEQFKKFKFVDRRWDWSDIKKHIPKLFKPSTKEAYDAQLVVKEPEFILPEKWKIKVTLENLDILSKYFHSISENYIGYVNNWEIQIHCFMTYPQIERNYWAYQLPTLNSEFNINYTEITFEQFKKYVLKEQLEEPKDKVLQINEIRGKGTTIIKVESSEGAVFELGDKITVFTKNSSNKSKILTIKGFRWNNTKTNICAITEVHAKNGIGLDKIELYSEPVKKELSLIEQAKLKYPIGTKVKSLFNDNIEGNIVNINFKYDGIWAELNTRKGIFLYVKQNNRWAEIIEDFKLPETWWITIENERQLKIAKQYFSQHFTNTSYLNIGQTAGYFSNRTVKYCYFLTTTTKQNNPQITFEQFEQYVLHNGFKVGDKFNKQKRLFNNEIIDVFEKEIIDLQYINNQSVAFYKIVDNGHTAPYCRILTKNIVR